MAEWFDVHNTDHCKAYQQYKETGVWPEDFELYDTDLGSWIWEISIMGKMVNAWIDYILNKEAADKREK